MTKLDIAREVPLAPLTTLGLGGPAKYFIRVEREPELVEALRWASEVNTRAAILGGGSNLIVPDEGYDGLVVHMAIGGLDFEGAGVVRVGAGVDWERVVEGAVSRSWAGVECLTGIPGLAGATPIQNVGAYGQEVAHVIDSVRVVDRASLEAKTLAPSDCGFSYRGSRFKREPNRFVVTAVRFALEPGGDPTLRYRELADRAPAGASLSEVRHIVLALRRAKSMVIDPADPNRRNAGSFFLNPVVDSRVAERIAEDAAAAGLVASPKEVPIYPADQGAAKLAAGWLIENTGIEKGFRRGAVGVSTKHALALVHHGGGTTTELLALADEIRDRVEERFGIRLEREPRMLA